MIPGLHDDEQYVWIVGFPKSGTTWIHYLVAYCLNLAYRNPDDPSNLPKKQWVREAVSGRHPWASAKGFSGIAKIHKWPGDMKQVKGSYFYVQRDPRDAFVSLFYFMKNKSFFENIGKMNIIKWMGLLGRRMQIRQFIRMWRDHRSAWAERRITVIEYEKMLTDGAHYLEECLKSAGFEVDRKIIGRAVETFSFEKMSGGRKPGETDKKSFFRKGVQGEYRQFFSPDELTLFQNLAD